MPRKPSWGLPDAGPATGTLYPQNRFPPVRLFPWKRQSDSGLWDQQENTIVSSKHRRSAGIAVPGRWVDECRDQAGLPARTLGHTHTSTEGHMGTPCTRQSSPQELQGKAPLLTQVHLHKASPQHTHWGSHPRTYLIPPGRMQSHPQSSQHQLQLCSPVLYSASNTPGCPAQDTAACQMGGQGGGSGSHHPAVPLPTQPGSCGPTLPPPCPGMEIGLQNTSCPGTHWHGPCCFPASSH